jgi:hypothetical protein
MYIYYIYNIYIYIYVYTNIGIVGAPNENADMNFIKKFVQVLSDNYPERWLLLFGFRILLLLISSLNRSHFCWHVRKYQYSVDRFLFRIYSDFHISYNPSCF